MPASSLNIADEFMRLAALHDRGLTQLQLQRLVYIAHGWCLAISGRPLTIDRPEAWEFGPVYRGLSDALENYGLGNVHREITRSQNQPYSACLRPYRQSDLDQFEVDVIERTFQVYGQFKAEQLSALTRGDGAPWSDVFADGAGKYRSIPNEQIRAQFVELAGRQSNPTPPTRGDR